MPPPAESVPVAWARELGRSAHARLARICHWCLEPLAARLRAFDHAIDLAEEIGTARWWRGVGVLALLLVLAFGFWPGLTPLAQATSARVDAPAAEEYRSQAIMPLLSGGDSGRRMGATPLARMVPVVPERPRVDLSATLGAGDDLTRMLQRLGVAPGEAAQASGLVAGAVPLATLAPGTPVALTLGARDPASGARPLEHLALPARFDLRLALDRQGQRLALTSHALAVDETPLRVTGLAGPSLYHAARAAGAPFRAIQQYLQVLDAHLGIDSVRPTDKFDLVLSSRRAQGGGVAPGDLLYAGLVEDGQPRAQFLRWGSSGEFQDAAEFGRQDTAARSGFVMPVAGHVTSSFGMRFHPILGYSRLHAGIDLGAPWGSPIAAAADGLVVWAGPHGGHGNYVRIDHGGGLATGYAHMSRFAVATGMRVRAGQVIGYVGSTGLSTGPHLHYEVYEGGRPVDPLAARITSRSPVDPAQVAAFRARLAKLLAVRPVSAPAGFGAGTSRIAGLR